MPTVTGQGDGGRKRPFFPVSLRKDVFDSKMRRQGCHSVQAQADRLGINRVYLFEIRAGNANPTLGLAFHMARAAGVGNRIDHIWEPRQDEAEAEAA